MKYKPYEYQRFATRHVLKHPYCGLLLDMGLGKTVATLTAVDYLVRTICDVDKVLVIAPLRVAQSTWDAEMALWDHLGGLRVSKILGKETDRIRAIRAKADVYVINRENIPWLVAYFGGHWPYDMVVIDELSSFKSSKSRRFRCMKQVRPYIKRVVGLTGTPMPNGLLDLWPQLYLLDQGKRLGKTITSYREKYFVPSRGSGHVVYEYELRKEESRYIGADINEKEIFDKIGDICISMKSEDYLDLPERVQRIIDIPFPTHLVKKYRKFERDQVMKIMDGEITAVNAASLSGKLEQFANGAIYDEDRNVHYIHDLKLDALEDLVEAANGKPIMIFYQFKHDLSRIKERLNTYNVRTLKSEKDVKDWNDGKIEVFLLHPASAGHGLNLQKGGNRMVWFGPTWNLELFQQAIKRLHRQGQLNTVFVYILRIKGTIDDDKILALDSKASRQDRMMLAVAARVKKYSKLLQL